MTEDRKIKAVVNKNAYLYESPDGREAWIMVQAHIAFIVTDVHGRGQPENAVGFTADTLRWIADRMDALDERMDD